MFSLILLLGIWTLEVYKIPSIFNWREVFNSNDLQYAISSL